MGLMKIPAVPIPSKHVRMIRVTMRRMPSFLNEPKTNKRGKDAEHLKYGTSLCCRAAEGQRNKAVGGMDVAAGGFAAPVCGNHGAEWSTCA